MECVVGRCRCRTERLSWASVRVEVWEGGEKKSRVVGAPRGASESEGWDGWWVWCGRNIAIVDDFWCECNCPGWRCEVGWVARSGESWRSKVV